MKKIIFLAVLTALAPARAQYFTFGTNAAQAVHTVTNGGYAAPIELLNGQPLQPQFSTSDFATSNGAVWVKRTNVAARVLTLVASNSVTILCASNLTTASYLVASNAGTAAANGMYTNFGFTGGFLQFNHTNGLYVATFNQNNSPFVYQANPMIFTSAAHATPSRLMYWSSGFPYDYLNQTAFPAAGSAFQMTGVYNGVDVSVATNPAPTIFIFPGTAIPAGVLTVDGNSAPYVNNDRIITESYKYGGTPTFVTNATTLVTGAQFIGQPFDGAFLFTFATTASPAQPTLTNLFTFTLSRAISTNFVVPTYSMASWPPFTNTQATVSARLMMQPNPSSPSNSFVVTIGNTALTSSSTYTVTVHVDRP